MGNNTFPLHILLATTMAALLVASPVSSVSLPSGVVDAITKLPNPWSAFQNLTDTHFGDEKKGLARLKTYLARFGYLQELPSGFTDTFDADLEEAIKTYQRNFRLDITGVLDPATITQMMAPRCGVADVINGTSSMAPSSHVHGRNLYSYFPGAPRWPRSKKSLTYAIAPTSETPAIDRATLRAVFARAFARWSAATTLNFTEDENAPARVPSSTRSGRRSKRGTVQAQIWRGARGRGVGRRFGGGATAQRRQQIWDLAGA